MRLAVSCFILCFVLAPGAQAQTPVVTFTPEAQIIPQIADGGDFRTTITLVNIGTVAAGVKVRFFKSSGMVTGATGTVTSAPQAYSIAGLGKVTTVDVTLQPNASSVLETNGDDPVAVSGYAEVDFSGTPGALIGGFAVFRQTVPNRPDQEVTVPMLSRYDLNLRFAVDNTSGYLSCMAVANPSATQTLNATARFYDLRGAAAGSQELPPMPPQTQVLLCTPDFIGAAKGNRGTVAFTAENGQLSVLALRFAPSGSITSVLPVVNRLAPRVGAF